MADKKDNLIKTEATIHSTVIESGDQKHRYLLTRTWDESKPRLLVLMIRPGYSDVVMTDTTTALCVQQAKGLEFGGVAIANIYSRLGVNGTDTANASDKENDRIILQAASEADQVVIATGRKNSRAIEERKAEVLGLLKPYAGKLYEIADKTGNTGFHPLSPRVRFEWRLVPLNLGGPVKVVET